MSATIDLGDVEATRGDAWLLPIEDYLSDDVTPVDLTAFGPTWTAQLRASEDDSLISSIAVDTTNLATGKVALSLPGSVMQTLSRPAYVFDVQVTGGTTSPVTPYRGRLLIDKDVTHA